jgi:hypothetical protein
MVMRGCGHLAVLLYASRDARPTGTSSHCDGRLTASRASAVNGEFHVRIHTYSCILYFERSDDGVRTASDIYL